jgi:hypothetical protein
MLTAQAIRADLAALTGQGIEQTPDGWALYDLADGDVHGIYTLADLAEYVRQVRP